MMEKPGKDRLRFLRRNPELRHAHLDMSIRYFGVGQCDDIRLFKFGTQERD